MPDENKRNLQFFEASAMRELFDRMDEWQNANRKRFLSLSIEKDGSRFCCIALTNPTEVVITDPHGDGDAIVSNGALRVSRF
jgi:hypothetical protein